MTTILHTDNGAKMPLKCFARAKRVISVRGRGGAVGGGARAKNVRRHRRPHVPFHPPEESGARGWGRRKENRGFFTPGSPPLFVRLRVWQSVHEFKTAAGFRAYAHTHEHDVLSFRDDASPPPADHSPAHRYPFRHPLYTIRLTHRATLVFPSLPRTPPRFRPAHLIPHTLSFSAASRGNFIIRASCTDDV